MMESSKLKLGRMMKLFSPERHDDENKQESSVKSRKIDGREGE